MTRTQSRAIDERRSLWESGVRKSPEATNEERSQLFDLPRATKTFEPPPMRDASPTLVEEPWFEEITDDAIVEEDDADLPERSVRVGPGGWLGRYQLLCPIAGTSSTAAGTFLARQHGDRGFSKLVALLTIPMTRGDLAECIDLVTEDARAAAPLHHPNVCEVLELGEDANVLYLATEWVHGISVADMLAESGGAPLPYFVAAHVIAQACAGMHAAHQVVDEDGRSHGLVHRDISLRNVVIDGTGHVKITGLGMARVLARLDGIEAAESTRAYPTTGRLTSMAPELVAGGTFDRRSDVFSLGAVLYEATTGVAPFRGENDYQVMDALMRGAYVPPSALVAGYPAELEAIVVRALERDPVRRFATAEGMRLALESWLERSKANVGSTQLAELVSARAGKLLAARREFVRELTAGAMASGVRRVQPVVSASSPPPPASPMSVRFDPSELSDPSIRLLEGARRRERWLKVALAMTVAISCGVVSYLSWTFAERDAAIPAARAAAEAATAKLDVATPTAERAAPPSVVPNVTATVAPTTPPAVTAKPMAPKAAVAEPETPGGALALPDSPY